MNTAGEYKIDARTAAEIQGQIKSLAASYTPEWVFDRENPDIGSVIALIFSNQMDQNIKRLNQTPEKYRTEFVNLLGLSLLPAYPAQGVAVVGILRDTVAGVDLPKGTKLLGQSEEEALPVVFETRSDVHITNSRLRDILTVSPTFGKIIPIMGSARKAPLIDGHLPPSEAEEQGVIPPFSLFDFTPEGIEQNCLMLYHKSVFDTVDHIGISVRLSGADTGEHLAGLFSDPERFKWSYLSDDGLKPFDKVDDQAGAVVLERTGGNAGITINGERYSMIALEALGPVREAIALSSIGISSACGPTCPDNITHNAEELEPDSFMPFGETASIFDECYIGHDAIFSQQGAEVTLRFHLSYQEKLVTLTLQQENEQLKVIKRKPQTVLYETVYTAVQRVTVEYFNGAGWRRLNCTQDVSTIFDGSSAGELEMSFLCPDDWQSLTIGGSTGRCLRMRVAQADNCYLQPCLHKMPVLSELTLSYQYPGEWKTPHRLRRVRGTEVTDLTGAMLDKRPFLAFEPLPYSNNYLFLGFDKKMTGGPVSVLFNVEQNTHFSGAAIGFEYSSPTGFKRLRVIDHTEGLSGVGTLLFMPPSDFAALEVEGVRRYWLRLADLEGEFVDPARYRPVIRDIIPNTVEIHNEETLPEEAFYIDVMTPNMSFPISAQNILSAEVFVNEKGSLSTAAMRKMALEHPQDVRVSYNFMGDISEFFVRWSEVDSFDHSDPTDRHYRIDRMTNMIHFGDGISVMAPKAQASEAFTVRARCCRGSGGNLPPGAVNATMGRILHIDEISNPVATWSGCDIESVEKAHERGASIISSKGRLVSATDLLREVKAFSSAIKKVSCVTGRDMDDRRDHRLVTIAIMMADYKSGSYSFMGIRDRLKQYLLDKCEPTMSAAMLTVTEPVYVELSVDVFAETSGAESTFEIQSAIMRALEDFIDPLSRGGRVCWEIGTLPDETQIGLLLGSIRCAAVIRRFTVTARYTDQNGSHECELDALRGNPFMIGVSGAHSVHITLI